MDVRAEMAPLVEERDAWSLVKMLRYLSRFVPWADPYAEAKRTARLTEGEALTIARGASPYLGGGYNLHFAAMAREDGEWLWVFSTSTRGQQHEVLIRDSDGKVVQRRTSGVR